MTSPSGRWPDEDLDQFWKSALNGARPPVHDRELGELARTARFVAAHDVVPGPRPDFTQRLRAELRQQSEEIAMPPVAVSAPSPIADSHPLPVPPARGRRIGRAWGAVELAGAALLIAAMLIAAIGWDDVPWLRGSNGARLGSQLSGSPTPASVAASPIPAATTQPATGTLRGDMARTGQMPGSGPVGLAAKIWQVNGDVVGEFVVAGNRVITYQNLPSGQNAPGSQNVLVVATDLATGATIWTATLDHRSAFASASVANGLVFAPTEDAIIALDERTGAVVWTYDVKVGVNSQTVAVADGLVYLTARDQTLRAVDAMTGKERWSVKIPASTTLPALNAGSLAITDSPAVADGVVYAVGNGGLLLAADARNGHQLWTFQSAADGPSTPIVVDGRVVLTSSFIVTTQSPGTSWIESIDAKTGALVWRRKESPEQTVKAVGDGALYLSSGHTTGVVTAVDASDGKTVRWTYTAKSAVFDGLLANGVLYVGTSDGVSTGLDVKTGLPVWNVRLATAGSPIPANGLAIIAGQGVITAVGGVQIPGTPTASPTALSGASTPVDLSGLPPCNPPRKVPAQFPTGTPSATLDAETKLVGDPVLGTIPQILVSNLPTGTPASPAVIAGMQQTLTDISNCMPPANESDIVAGFFTDDFYRRGWAGGGSGSYFHGWPGRSLNLTAINAVVLPDGRVAAQINYNDTPKMLYVFVEQKGRWLIDEQYLIVKTYKSGVG